jgi:hypothetical protein
VQRSGTTGSKWLGVAWFFVTLFPSTALIPAPAAAATLMVGRGQTYAEPSDAAAAAQPGDTVIITPATYHNCAVWNADNLTIEASAPGVVLQATVCEEKAIFVISGNDVTIQGITFTGARSDFGNGAGIRAQGVNLTVINSTFSYDQDGILADPNPTSTITINGSTFYHDGACHPHDDCAHGIYVGQIALLQIDNSTFYDTQVGNHIQSRAFNTQISNSSIEDGPVGTASYLVNVPNGGNLAITNTVMEKGPKATNYTTAISIGVGGVSNSTNQLLVSNNTFTNSGRATVFATNDTVISAQLVGNTLLGNPITPLLGPGTVQ